MSKWTSVRLSWLTVLSYDDLRESSDVQNKLGDNHLSDNLHDAAGAHCLLQLNIR
jgi:hypothetical protein